MGRTTTYTCDVCGAQAVDEHDFLVEVWVTVPEPYSLYSSRSTVKKASLCPACMLRLGLRSPSRDETKPEPPPTFEDTLRELIRDEITQSQQGR